MTTATKGTGVTMMRGAWPYLELTCFLCPIFLHKNHVASLMSNEDVYYEFSGQLYLNVCLPTRFS